MKSDTKNFKQGDKVWFLYLQPQNNIYNHVPKAVKAEILYIDKSMVHLKYFGIFRSHDCIFKTKKELLKKISRC